MKQVCAILLASGFLVASGAGAAWASDCCAVQAQAPKQTPAKLQPASKIAELKFAVEGIFCADCVTHIEKALKEQKGFGTVRIDPQTGAGRLTYDPSLVTKNQLIQAISDTGYKAKLL